MTTHRPPLALELEHALRSTRDELNGLDDLAEQLRCLALELAAAVDRTGHTPSVRAVAQLRLAAADLQAWQIADQRRSRARAVTAVLERARAARQPIGAAAQQHAGRQAVELAELAELGAAERRARQARTAGAAG